MKWRLLVPVVLILVTYFVSARSTPHFGDIQYLLERSTPYREIGLPPRGMTFVIATGKRAPPEGSTWRLAPCLPSKRPDKGWSLPAGIAAACVIGATLGA